MKKKVWLILALFLVVSFIISIGAGRYIISVPDLFSIIFDKIGIKGILPAPSEDASMVFWNIRFPRVLMSFAIGSGLSEAGVVYQSLFRNPLASPDILGVSAGASFGAAFCIVIIAGSTLCVQGFAFGFGILAVAITYIIAARSYDKSTSVLVIAGTVVLAVSIAGLSLMEYMADPYNQLAQIMFWMMGSFQTTSWDKIQFTLPIILAGSAMLCIFSWRLNIMTLEDREILSMGINARKWRIFYILISTLVVASSVSTVGDIKWVGLIIPHISRRLIGTDNKKLVPFSALLGGGFIMLMDTLSRSATTMEIPISIITSFLGGPFLAYLLMSRKVGALRNGN